MSRLEYLQDVSWRFYDVARRTIVPELQYSQVIFEEVLKSCTEGKNDWLDIGCGHHLLPIWRRDEETKLVGGVRNVVGLDPDFPGISKHRTIVRRVQGNADALPFEEGSFDIVTANMVVEHLDNPRRQFSEICRILKPGGFFVFHTVNKGGYFARLRRLVPDAVVKRTVKLLDGRDGEDVFDVHYKANSPKTIDVLCKEMGFEIEAIKFISSDAVFAAVPPLAALELMWIKLLMFSSLRRWRTNLIVVLRKKNA